MDLVINKVVELQHINIAHGHLAVETIARTAVEQVYLARTVKSGEFQHVRNVRLTRTVEHRRCPRHAIGDRKSTRLNSSHQCASRRPSSACNKKTKTRNS